MKTYNLHSRTNINFVHHNFEEIENLSNASELLKAAILGYYALAVAKSAAERGNSNISQLANSSTPLNRAFFVRSLRTPKENNKLNFEPVSILSMVGRNGQRLIVGCFPVEAVFHPVMLYRQAWKLAVVPQISQLELSSMIYKFLLLGSKRLKITVHANNKAEALSRVQFASKPLLVARLRNPFVNNSQNPTACDTEQNNSLPSVGGCSHNDLTTTTLDGSRNRYTSGLFLPKIHNQGITTPEIYSELAVRATPRNKAEFIRANKGGYSSVAVEPLSHLSQGDKPFYPLTKTLETMKKPTQTGTTATNSPIVRSPRFEGVAYA